MCATQSTEISYANYVVNVGRFLQILYKFNQFFCNYFILKVSTNSWTSRIFSRENFQEFQLKRIKWQAGKWWVIWDESLRFSLIEIWLRNAKISNSLEKILTNFAIRGSQQVQSATWRVRSLQIMNNKARKKNWIHW